MGGDDICVLHHEWCLRGDDKRVLLFQADVEGRIEHVLAIDPGVAVVFTLFDGNRTVAEVGTRLSELFDQSPEASAVLVRKIMETYYYAFEYRDRTWAGRTFDPRQFLISAQDIDLRRKKLYRPLTLTLHVSDWCMRDCRYCNVEKRRVRPDALLPLSRWVSLAEEASSLGVHSVLLAGGDPFMRREIAAIIEAFLTRGIKVAIATKSRIPRSLANTLAGLGIHRMQYSLDSADPIMADFLTRSPGFFRQAVESISNLTSAGIQVYVNAVMTNRNARGAPSLLALLRRLGVCEVFLAQCGFSSFSPESSALLLSCEDARWLEDYVRDHSEPEFPINFSSSKDPLFLSQPERIEAWRKLRCGAGTWSLVIHSDGKVTLCALGPTLPECVVGDLTHQSIMDVWNSPECELLLRPPRSFFLNQPCFECDEFDECHSGKGRCFAHSYAAVGQVFATPPECPRSLTPIRMR